MGYQEVTDAPAGRRGTSNHTRVAILSLSLLAIIWLCLNSQLTTETVDKELAQVQKCSIDNLRKDLSFLDTAVPIAADEFLERRDRLAGALYATNVDAFVLEPGYTFQ